MATKAELKKVTKLKRLSGLLRAGFNRIKPGLSKELKQGAMKMALGATIPRLYPASRVLDPETALDIMVAMYLAIPPELRFITHEVLEGFVDGWLPDDSMVKHALLDALATTHFATEAFLSQHDLTDEKIRSALEPVLNERFKHHTDHPPEGGRMSDTKEKDAKLAHPSFLEEKARELWPMIITFARRVFTGKNAERVADEAEMLIDRVEDAVYPGVLWSYRLGFSLPVASAALILMVVAVPTLLVQTFVLNEYALAWQTLSSFELARRGVGFAMNAAYQIAVPATYLVVALVVGSPYLGIRRRTNGNWTWWEPKKPADPLPGTEPPGVTREEHVAKVKKAYEADADGYRASFRQELMLRGGIVAATLIVGTILVAVAGMVVSIPTYQHLTVVQLVAISVINFHILWLGDDLANAIKKVVSGKEAEHADGAHEKHPITRIRKISGTMTIIVAAAAFTYLVGIHLAPWAWVLVTLLVTYLLLGMAVFLVSRILFGNSSDAPHDVQEDSAKQRRFVHKTVAGIFGFSGAAVFITSMAISVVYHGYGWYKDCEGYEGTYECSLASDDGYAQYVDSRDRWEAMRDRSAKALQKRKNPKPVGDMCVIAKKKVEAINDQYRTSALSGTAEVPDEEVCSMLAHDGELRGQFPEWSKTCATMRVACGVAKR